MYFENALSAFVQLLPKDEWHVVHEQGHRIDTLPEVQLHVGTFDVCVLVFSAAAIFLASLHGKCLRYTEDVDVVFAKKNGWLLTLDRRRWTRMLCDNSNLHKQKLVKPKPLPRKMAAVKKVGQTMAKLDFWLSIYSVTAY